PHVMGFWSVLDPIGEQRQPMTNHDLRAVRKRVADEFFGAPRKLSGHEPIRNGGAGADSPEHARFDVEGTRGPWLRGGGDGGKRGDAQERSPPSALNQVVHAIECE